MVAHTAASSMIYYSKLLKLFCTQNVSVMTVLSLVTWFIFFKYISASYFLILMFLAMKITYVTPLHSMIYNQWLNFFWGFKFASVKWRLVIYCIDCSHQSFNVSRTWLFFNLHQRMINLHHVLYCTIELCVEFSVF